MGSLSRILQASCTLLFVCSPQSIVPAVQFSALQCSAVQCVEVLNLGCNLCSFQYAKKVRNLDFLVEHNGCIWLISRG